MDYVIDNQRNQLIRKECSSVTKNNNIITRDEAVLLLKKLGFDLCRPEDRHFFNDTDILCDGDFTVENIISLVDRLCEKREEEEAHSNESTEVDDE